MKSNRMTFPLFLHGHLCGPVLRGDVIHHRTKICGIGNQHAEPRKICKCQNRKSPEESDGIINM